MTRSSVGFYGIGTHRGPRVEDLVGVSLVCAIHMQTNCSIRLGIEHWALGIEHLYIATLQRLQHSAGTVAHAKLRQDARRVVLDRPLGGAERVGNLTVAVAARHHPQDLDL